VTTIFAWFACSVLFAVTCQDPAPRAVAVPQAVSKPVQSGAGLHTAEFAPPTRGELVALDPALLVVPPKGKEVGHVPIVTRQERAR
jgi:hypothetical protein